MSDAVSAASRSTPVPRDFHAIAWRFPVAIAATGLFAGISGMLLALLLHALQHIAFGYSLDAIIGPISFLEGVQHASPMRRLIVLLTCGAIAGVGWWLVYRFGRPLVAIRKAVANPELEMPIISTLGHALLQIITVALGSPLGREVAPREVGALFGGWLGRKLKLSLEQVQILIACGAGAGLAAVYNVPFAGAVFVLEVLLVTFNTQVAAAALFTSAIAAYVAWLGLGDASQYALPPLQMGISLVVWAAICGPIFGVAGLHYGHLAAWARKAAPRQRQIILWCVGAFGLLGVLSMAFPQLLGNGKGPIQLGLNGGVSTQLALTLLVLKLFVTTLCLRAGAEGGLLTPGMTIGALLALVLGSLWNMLGFSPIAMGAFALIGASAFLAVSMNMPLTAIALAFGFTGANQDFYIPILIAVSLATMTAKQYSRFGSR
ncbi:chloride channel protein [Allorhizobium terrae]|uniref:Chloride channel protein n=1 Tax=Allorhizobium terrae TaxID=1848972 RepID=A0A4S3ZUE9_9HYPH|nr:chloride channel protein [Allorhizobium terrae]THF49358.1 chloride channel protein [Allorhizobium terrae]